jgi:formate/nitrite transporter FocA (FNT family)
MVAMKDYQKALTLKAAQNRWQLGSRSVLAGIILSVAGFLSVIATVVTGNLIISSLLFSFGLVLIILVGAELFTSNCLVVLKPKFPRILARLVKVYLFNLLGVVILTMVLWGAGSLNGYQDAITSSAETKAGLSPFAMVLSGSVANFLVCLAAWLGVLQTGSAKLAGIIMPIMTFVMIKAEHSIANMFIFAAAAFLQGGIDPAYFSNLIWVTVGNVIGVLMFALIIHGAYKK